MLVSRIWSRKHVVQIRQKIIASKVQAFTFSDVTQPLNVVNCAVSKRWKELLNDTITTLLDLEAIMNI